MTAPAVSSKRLLSLTAAIATPARTLLVRHRLAPRCPSFSLTGVAGRCKYATVPDSPAAVESSPRPPSSPPTVVASTAPSAVSSSQQTAQPSERPLTAKEASQRRRKELEESGVVLSKTALKQTLAKARVQWRKENPDLVKARTEARKARQAEQKEALRANSEAGLTPEEVAAKRSREKLEKVQIAQEKKLRKKMQQEAKAAKKLTAKISRKLLFEEARQRSYERKAAHALAQQNRLAKQPPPVSGKQPPPVSGKQPSPVSGKQPRPVSVPPPPAPSTFARLGFNPSGTFEYSVDLPTGTVPITVTYTQDTDKIREWLETHANHAYMGMDTERKPTFKKGGVREKTALLQLSTPDGHVLLLNHFQFSKVDRGKYQPYLENLLRDPKVLKAGVGIWQDFNFLIQDWKLDIDNDLSGKCGVVDIMALAIDDPRFPPPRTDVDTPEHPWIEGADGIKRPPIMKYGLVALTERYLGFVLGKAKSIQTANWACHFPMKRAMSEYAAKDAWVGARILAELTKDMSPEEIRALPEKYYTVQKPARAAKKKDEKSTSGDPNES
ncbi:hypothetical protein HDU86_007711 [Geranomyces michiganensis]|nr:hypothetical protein HDU86_007711 [Geranomyces michiganensis]